MIKSVFSSPDPKVPGIARIKNECRGHGVKEPIFEEFVHGFRVGKLNPF